MARRTAIHDLPYAHNAKLEERVKAKHKDLALDVILHIGAGAAFPVK